VKLPLHQGSYDARSPIANAQVAINLLPEQNPADAPFPVTMYPAPGLSLMTDQSAWGNKVRGMYVASDGALYVAVGVNILRFTGYPFTATQIGAFPEDSLLPVSICDNGTTVVAVDGTVNSLYATLGSNTMTAVSDPAWYGSARVDFIDTFFVFNQPGTGNFYTSTSNAFLPIDPLYFAAKEGWNDRVQCCACLHDNIWVLGAVTSEIWFNAGGAAFPFARMPNSILQQGCAATFSVVIADNAIYWLSQDRWGHAIMMRGEGYSARRVSNFAVENAWRSYNYNLSDAIGMAFQIGGHEFIGLRFPLVNKFWVYDASTQMWHERTYNGTSAGWLPNCTAFWQSVPGAITPLQTLMIAGDSTSGRIMIIDAATYTDVGTPITRQRSWPHQQQDGQRINYTRFALSMAGNQLSPDTVTLDWSDDAGLSYGSGVAQTVNQQSNGQYLWRRLGYGRDRVYRATWTGNGEFALNGAYSDGTPAAT